MNDEDKAAILRDFKAQVNMAPAELERWLQTEASQTVGAKSKPEAESVGHDSGRRIVEIKRTKKADLTDADYRHMKKVIGYIARHTA